MNRPLVSVIMPVFNAEPYIKDSLQSILSQTYKNLEVLIVDDVCTDGSMQVVVAIPDSRVKIIRNEKNLGLAASINKAIRLSTGQYLARMDADDVALPERIDRQVAFLEKNQAVDIIGTAMRFTGYSQYLSNFPILHQECRIQLLFNVCFGHPTVIFRRNVFDDPMNFYDESLKQYSEEYDLWCRLSNRHRFHNLNEPLLLYRTYPPGIKVEAEELRKRNTLLIQEKYLNSLFGPVSARDFSIHTQLSLMEIVHDRKELKECDEWLQRLIALNETKKEFEEKSFSKILAKRFFEFCYSNSARGLFVLFYYYRSNWARFYRPAWKKRGIHLLKSILKK